MCVYRADPEDDHYSQCEPVPACVQWMEEFILVDGHLDGSRLMGSLCKKGDEGQGVIVADHFRLDEQCLDHVAAYQSSGRYDMHGVVWTATEFGRAWDQAKLHVEYDSHRRYMFLCVGRCVVE